MSTISLQTTYTAPISTYSDTSYQSTSYTDNSGVLCASKTYAKAVLPALNLESKLCDLTELTLTTPPDKKLEITINQAKEDDERGDGEGVMRSLLKAIALSRIVFGDHSLQLAVAHIRVGTAYCQYKRLWKQGESHAADAVLHAENNETSADQLRVLVEAYYLLAVCRLELENSKASFDAITASTNCARELDFIGEEIHPDLLYKVHTTAGRCYLAQSNHSEALESFETAQSTALVEWGESAPQLVYLYQYIVQAQLGLNDHSAASETARQGVTCATSHSDPALQGDAIRCLADVHMRSGGHNSGVAAEELLRKSVLLYTAAFSGVHPVTMAAYDALIDVLIKEHEHDRARKELSSLVNAKKTAYGDPSPELADCYQLIGSLLLIEGEIPSATQTFKQAQTTLCSLYPSNHPKVKSIKKTLASLAQTSHQVKECALDAQEKLADRPRFNLIHRSTS